MRMNESLQVPPTSNPLAELKAKFDVPLGEATKIKPELTNLEGASKNPEKITEVLNVILDLEHQTHVAYELWRDKLVQALGWQHLNLRAVGLVLANLERKGLIVEWRNDKKRKLGFMLDDDGLRFLGLLKEKPIVSIPPPIVINPEPAVDVSQLLATNADVFMECAALGEKVKSIKARQRELRQEIDMLEIELEELIKGLNQPLREFVLKLQSPAG